jgi:non-ribosomal peptide synthetase component F
VLTGTSQGFELSPQQKLIWSLQQRDGHAAYLSRCTLAVNGALEPALLAEAVRRVVASHEALRTSFEYLPGMARPLQVISAQSACAYQWQDLCAPPAGERQAGGDAWLEREDVGTGSGWEPLLRVRHLRLGPRRHLLRLEISALCADAVSLHLLGRQVREAYLRLRQAEELAEPRLQYADLAETLNACLESEEFEQGREFWREQVELGREARLRGMSRGEEMFQPRQVGLELGPELIESVRRCSERSGVSREGLLLACWCLLLCRVEGEEEVVVGVSCEGRTHEVLREVMGLLSRHVPFRFRWKVGSSFQEVARATDSLRGEISEVQYYFDPSMMEADGEGPGQRYGACFEYMSLSESEPGQEPEFVTESVFSVTERFVIKLTAVDAESGLRLQVEYDAGAVEEREAVNVGRQYVEMLESAVGQAGAPAKLLEMMSVEAKRGALAEGRGATTPLSGETPTVSALAEVVERERRAERGLEAPPILPAPRHAELPLSFAQQRLWFIHQLEPESAAYNIPLAVRLHGALNLPRLRQSLSEIARRHEALRTRFIVRDGRPAQLIDAAQEVEVALWDLSGVADDERQARVQDVVLSQSRRPFDLERGPVWRAALLRLDSQEHVLLLELHHVVSDGWSLGVLVKECAALEERYARGEQSELEELRVQYADFAVWQRAWLRGEALERELSYWREELAGMEVLELPTDKPRPAVASHRGASVRFRLPAELAQELKALSRREGATLFMTLLAAFQMTLGRYAGQRDVVVGSDVANRNRLETEGLIGFFVNQLALRADLSGNPSFGELLRQVRERTLGAYAHQDLPFEKLVEELSPARDRSRSPLFQVKLVLQNAPLQTGGPRPLGVTWFPVNISVAKFDLLFNLIETGDGLQGTLSFCSDLFTQGSVNWLLNLYEAALKKIAQPESLETPINTLMADVEALLKSKTQEGQYHLFRSGSRLGRRKLPLISRRS